MERSGSVVEYKDRWFEPPTDGTMLPVLEYATSSRLLSTDFIQKNVDCVVKHTFKPTWVLMRHRSIIIYDAQVGLRDGDTIKYVSLPQGTTFIS